jgi:DNA-3-methyladenine glycosylase II
MTEPLPKIKHFSVKIELAKATNLDPGLSKVIMRCGYPASRRREPGFSTLANIINSQLLSTQSASAIWQRFKACCEGRVTPQKVVSLGPDKLRSCGLSTRKSEYIFDLAHNMLRGEVDIDGLANMEDSDVLSNLVCIRGMGLWSAEIYAMFALGRRDFYPARDLALQVAIQKYMELETRPDEKFTIEFCKRWSPHRSAVSLSPSRRWT